MKHDSHTRRGVVALIGGGLGAALTGCGSVITAAAGDPPRLFRLSSKSTFPENLKSVEWQLVVDTPSAPASINTNRIGLMETPYRFNYFAKANWVDRAPIMVQSLIIESFDNSNSIVGVGPGSIGLRPNFVLQPELREFQAHQNGAEQEVQVVINARLVQMPERRIVAVQQFERKVVAPALSFMRRSSSRSAVGLTMTAPARMVMLVAKEVLILVSMGMSPVSVMLS